MHVHAPEIARAALSRRGFSDRTGSSLSFFIALGLDPAVRWLHHRGLPRWASVAVVLLSGLGVFALFLAFAVPLVVTQASHLAKDIPGDFT